MKAERWKDIETVLDAALDSDPSSWPALLDRHCSGDEELRGELESLLRHHAGAQRFLAAPPAGAAAALVAERSGTRVEGMRIGAYRVVRQVGQGGTARVYLAERDDGQFTQQVALKLLRPGHDSEVDHERFRAERQILASLSHPNIARLLDGGLSDDRLPYLVMELVQGEPIDRYCDARSLSLHERLRMFVIVCGAVRYAHRNLVVHRDLKPSNILVTTDGQVKLLDFGLAKLLEHRAAASPTAPLTSKYWMTPEYAAPEQVRGEAATTLTDVYQLGVVLFELLTGTLPFGRRESSHDLAHDILEREPPPPSSVANAKALRGDLDAIALTALRKEPEHRYASVEALCDDVQRYLDGLPVHARKGSAAYRARRFVSRHSIGVAAAAAFVVLLAGYAVTLTVHANRVRATLARVEQEKAKAEASSQFLVGLFSPYGAGFGPRDTITARQLILRGERDVEELKGRPLAQAQLLGVLGSILRTMRDYDQADSLLTRALALRRGNLEANHADVAESMFQLGILAHSRGQTRRAREMLSGALDIQRPVLGEQHPATVETVLRLSLVMGTSIDARIVSDREALALARRAYGDEHPTAAEAMLRLGMSLRSKGALEESERVLRDALALRRRVSPDDEYNVMRHVAQLAILLRQRGALDEAERLHRLVLAAHEARYGPDHPAVSGALRTLAEGLLARGNIADAERLARRDLGMRERAYGRMHVEYGLSAAHLADVLRAADRLPEAEALRRAELDAFRATYGPGHVNIAGSLHHLGVVLIDQRRYDEAAPLLAEARALREAHSGIESPPPAYILPAQSRLAREQGDFVAADTLIRRALRIMKSHGCTDAQIDVQQAHREAVRLYEAWGKADLAARHRALLIAPR